MSIPTIPHRPSTWPVRRERQMIATIANMNKFESWFQHITQELIDIKSRLPLEPPGLATQHPDNLEHRISRLETLWICKPNPEVDHVLEEMLHQRPMVQIAADQPEPEKSPLKEPCHEICKTLEFDNPTVTQLFTIFDEIPKDASSQTDIMVHSVASQTLAHKKPRTGRVNGRATQTMQRSAEASTVCTDVMDTADRNNVGQAPQLEKPCVIDENFINVLMASMEQLMDDRLAASNAQQISSTTSGTACTAPPPADPT